MHDPKTIVRDPDAFVAHLTRRRVPDAPARVAEIVEAAEARRDAAGRADALQAERNALGRDAPPAQARALREQVQDARSILAAADTALDDLLLALPNTLLDEVPDGADDTANVEVSWHGTPDPDRDGAIDHIDIGTPLGLDLAAGAHLGGHGFVVLQGVMARLNRALISFMLDRHGRHGYREVAVPFLVKQERLQGTGQLPKFADELYLVDDGELGLVPTAEVPLTNLFGRTILDGADLPKKLTAYSPCFRREAGAHGRDTAGMIRVHQFEKVELVRLCRTDDEARAALDAMVADASDVLTQLELPHRVVKLCAGDTGFAASLTFDLEVWLPSQRRYREISSCSTCGTFQARRMGLRWRDEQGRTHFVHTLNGSGVAVGRALVAMLENHQRPDGSVWVPRALRPYLSGADHLVR